jgi:hypothetical protein
MALLELLGMWQVLVLTGPFCPHARSILIFLPALFPLARVLIDAFTAFPMETAWLDRSISNIGAAGYSLNF